MSVAASCLPSLRSIKELFFSLFQLRAGVNPIKGITVKLGYNELYGTTVFICYNRHIVITVNVYVVK